ncbi:hypothetical protein HGM15179_008694 [Zosterops borbonicus]|uniref:Uncharacterized protein n=1 Tax=Zosterops borbonicus TaxID=364589 RepID=A0A8K1LLY8_9PASS|nr:hypothetical protein HGM15179_008694 [Zosterops borbonicus]
MALALVCGSWRTRRAARKRHRPGPGAPSPSPPCTPGQPAPARLSGAAATLGSIGLVIVAIIVSTLPVSSVWSENYAQSIQIRDLPGAGGVMEAAAAGAGHRSRVPSLKAQPFSIFALSGPSKTNPLPAHIFPGNRKYSPDPAYYGY